MCPLLGRLFTRLPVRRSDQLIISTGHNLPSSEFELSNQVALIWILVFSGGESAGDPFRIRYYDSRSDYFMDKTSTPEWLTR